jgi:hypothetical protein
MRKKYLVAICLALLVVGVFSFLFAQNFLDTKPTMQFTIPKDYGLLVTIYPAGTSTVMWFEAQDGTIRRVILDGQGNFDLNVWAITRQ